VLARQSEDEGGGLFGLAVGHAGDRLVEQEELLVLHQQHADLEPLLLAVAERAGELEAAPGEADRRQRRGDALALGVAEHGEKRAPGAAIGLERELEILEDAEILEHRRL